MYLAREFLEQLSQKKIILLFRRIGGGACRGVICGSASGGLLTTTPCQFVIMEGPYSINAVTDDITEDTPLIAQRSVSKHGTPKNIGYLLSVVYFILRMYFITF